MVLTLVIPMQETLERIKEASSILAVPEAANPVLRSLQGNSTIDPPSTSYGKTKTRPQQRRNL